MGRIHGYGDKKDGEFVLFSGDLKGIGVADGQDLLGDKGDEISAFTAKYGNSACRVAYLP